ncbi:MAG TPA: acetate--CoA ligase family protein, partial [Candidatus Desulfaltia sp.]|nr:acetate--CoA ligase family protein [Candidatus Desulfaltia sp.]
MMAGAGEIEKIFERAEKDHRNFLLEHEVYALLKRLGIATPRFVFIKKGQKASAAQLTGLKSPRVVLKVVSPQIVHKSDVGGVAFVENKPGPVNRAIIRMRTDVPKKFEAAGKTAADIRGVLVLEKVAYADLGFGSELLVGIRHSREFGPVVTIGLGGLDVEYLHERLKERGALAIVSAHLLRRREIIPLLEPLAAYDKLVKGFRGKAAPVSGETLAATCERFIDLAVHFSPYSRRSAFVIEEAEVNPFVIRDGRLVPLDGMCRFSRAHALSRPRLHEDIESLLHPRSIGIIGVSERLNLGHLILNNILREGFPKDKVYVVKPGQAEIEGCRCVPAVAELPEAVDLFVLTLAAEQSAGVMAEIVAGNKARSVIIIAGGLGEKKGTEGIEEEIRRLLRRSRREKRSTPVVNGGNCMGIYSGPGRYDTTFIPVYKLASPGKKDARLVYISQSGAFMASRMSKIPRVEAAYGISLGNQIDLTASDYLNYFKARDSASLYALYLEGFQPGDGLALAEAAREIVRRGKQVLVYKSGRSPEGRRATSSHTASVAGDYAVCRAVLENAGAFVAETLAEFESAVRVLPALAGKPALGRRVGLISNAGFECVILADSLKDGFELELATLSERSRARIGEILKPLGIDRLQDIRNPLDLTPVADDAAFAGCVEALLEDPGVDCAVVSPVPMTAALQTLAPSEAHSEDIFSPRSIGRRLVEVFRRTRKPVVVNIDAGALYDPLANMLEEAGLPVFRRSDEALRFLAKSIQV